MIPTGQIRNAEVDLISHGYSHRLWRRGVMGTRVFARGNERVVLVRNAGQDRHPQEDETPTVEHWFVRLEAELDDLVKGAKLTDLLLFSDNALPVPARFVDWCEAQRIRIHVSSGSFSPVLAASSAG